MLNKKKQISEKYIHYALMNINSKDRQNNIFLRDTDMCYKYKKSKGIINTKFRSMLTAMAER